jgi:hypothetical protein
LTQHPYLKFGPRGPEGVSVLQYTPGNPPVGRITVRENTFIAPLPMAASPCAVSTHFSGTPGQLFHMAGLAVTNNTFVNFPQDGKELQVVTDPAYNPDYAHAGNNFAPAK